MNAFLDLEGKNVAVFGLSSRRSIAWITGQTLEALGARVIYGVHTQARRESLSALLGERPCFVCEVQDPEQINDLPARLGAQGPLHGLVHALAFANYSEGFKPFHETLRADFLQAMQISCFSLVEISRVLKPLMHPQASVVTLGISSQVTAENYGYMAPVKAALESSVRFLAKSFSSDTQVRFNSVNSGPLKTTASAGIPGYVKAYLYAEAMTFRKKALTTQEVANAIVFLLSPVSSGINAQSIVVNAGMDCNYFDTDIINKVI